MKFQMYEACGLIARAQGRLTKLPQQHQIDLIIQQVPALGADFQIRKI
jgi:hypothetical protein